jgi:hypothetical protein
MVEFTSEPQKPSSRIVLFIMIGLVIVLLGGIAFYVYRQRGMPSKPTTAPVTIAGLIEAGDTNFEFYKTRIRIENVSASLGVSLSNSRTAFIAGTILNDGDRMLEAVRLHITLYDSQGKVSKERTTFILKPGPGSSGKAMEPLEKRSFTTGVDSVEHNWNPKQISYEITGLKYR